MPYVYETAGRYICAVNFDDRYIPEEAGFQFSKSASDERPVWHTNRPEVAYRLLKFCEVNTKHSLIHKFNKWHSVKAEPVRYPLVYSRNFTPEDYQIDGAQHILSRKYSYLWYEAGTGKTFTASMALEYLSMEGYTNLVICPSFLKYTWREEIDEKSKNFLDVYIALEGKAKLRPSADIIIIPDSLLHNDNLLERLDGLNIGAIIIDEGHRFKNEESGRSSVLCTRKNLDHTYLGKISKHLCTMSGTPMPNYKPIEIWPIVNAFAPESLGFMTKYEYGRKYCGSVTDEYGTSYGGCTNVEDLIKKLKTSGYMKYQELREGDVPPQALDQYIYLDPTKELKRLKAADEEVLKHVPLEEILKAARGISPKINAKFNMKLRGSEAPNPKDFLAELRRLSGEQVADLAVPILNDIVKTGGEPIVVFAWHKSVITKLTLGLEKLKPLVIDGSVPMDQRQSIVSEYQKGDGKVIILNIVAGGLGFTLTKACKVYFVEFDWTEGNNDQCVRRLRRKGQKKVVTPYYFVFKNSLAHTILSVLAKKSRNKNAVEAALKES